MERSKEQLIKEALNSIKSLGYSWEWHSGNYYFSSCKEGFEDSYSFSIEDGVCDGKYLVRFNFKKMMFEELKVNFTETEKEAINKFLDLNKEEFDWYKNH